MQPSDAREREKERERERGREREREREREKMVSAVFGRRVKGNSINNVLPNFFRSFIREDRSKAIMRADPVPAGGHTTSGARDKRGKGG